MHQSQMNDGFSGVMHETVTSFQGDRINVLGDGIKEVLSENVLFESYRDKLCQGLDADDAQIVSQLLENTRAHILSESALSGIQPISSLAGPMLRKVWPRIGAIHAIPTEAVKLPKFSISYMTPYITDSTGVKRTLPNALRGGQGNDLAERAQLDSGYIDVPSANFDLIQAAGGSALVGDAVDVDFYITKVEMEVLDAADANAETVEVEVKLKLETGTGVVNGEITGEHSDGTANTDTVFGKLDRGTGMFTLASVAQKIKKVQVLGYLSSEMNNRAESVGFDINYKDVDIGTGAHLTAPLPTEWLQDTMALYQVDGALKVVDIMSDVLSQKIDIQAINFLDEAHATNGLDAAAVQYANEFDVRPSAAFSGSPKEWREEIRTVIDHMATTMKNDSAFTNGTFRLLGNALDLDLITNVDWTFNHSAEERGGVEVNYNVGAYSGSNRYELLSTPNVAAGDIKVIYVPSQQDQMTFKYYPYAFAVERNNGYRDPNHPNVPAVVMSRRHTFEKMTPLVGKVTVKNNDGKLPA
jgi:hypothetical protein